MALKLHFFDKEYPYIGYKETRTIVRGILMDKDGNFLVHEIERDDKFGHHLYYETPGGGKEPKECFMDTLRREVMEETGRPLIGTVRYLGGVIDWHNPLKRENKIFYFFGRVDDQIRPPSFKSVGDSLIKRTLIIPIGEAIDLVKGTSDSGISLEVKRRELPFWLYVKEHL